MIQARLVKQFQAGPESTAFLLDLELCAEAGITVLYGSSGAGKTVTLDCIAGFVRPDTGRILLDGEIVFDAGTKTNLRPQQRRLGYVFQTYALFPHMTLRENLIFAAARRPRLERHHRVNELLERFQLRDLAGRLPHELSGGQKQRCSIARALIGNPRLLLLDEPARGLDSALREDFYEILRDLRRDFRIPMLLVTHDLEECFAVGDSLVVFSHGRIVQAGEPRRVLDEPATPEVARVLGITNIFEAEVLALDPGRNTSRLRAFGQELMGRYYPGRFLGDRISVCVHSSDLRIHSRAGDNRIPVKFMRALERRQSVRVEFSCDIAVETSQCDYEKQRGNREWFVEFPPRALHVIG